MAAFSNTLDNTLPLPSFNTISTPVFRGFRVERPLWTSGRERDRFMLARVRRQIAAWPTPRVILSREALRTPSVMSGACRLRLRLPGAGHVAGWVRRGTRRPL